MVYGLGLVEHLRSPILRIGFVDKDVGDCCVFVKAFALRVSYRYPHLLVGAILLTFFFFFNYFPLCNNRSKTINFFLKKY